MKPADISIIVVNYNTGDLAVDCIRSVQQKTSGVTYELIVVDNASSDGSCKRIRSIFNDMCLIESDTNRGFAAANNIGVRRATGKYLLLLNPDTVLVNNAPKKMFDFMEEPRNEEVAVCGALLTGEDGHLAVSSGDFPSVGRMILHSLPWGGKLFEDSEWKRLKKRDEYGRCIVDFVTGASLFIRKQVFEGENGFDESYFAYYEETDLCKRISLRGHRAAIVEDARIVHLQGRSLKSPMRRKQLMYESSLRYLAKYEGASFLFKLYCWVNEVKCRSYIDLLPFRFTQEDRTTLKQMADLSVHYRRRPEDAKA